MPQGTDPGLVNTWREKLTYPLLLFVLFEALLYLIVKGYGLRGEMLPFTSIVTLAILVTQIRLVSGIYVSNLLVGILTILYFIHQKYYMLQDLTDPTWLRLLFQTLKLSALGLWTKDFSVIREVAITLLIMCVVWFGVHIVLKRLVQKGKILGLLLIGLIVQGLIFSYIARTMNTANIVFMIAGLILLSLVRLGKLQNRWKQYKMFGAEDVSLKWGAGASLLIFIVVLLAALAPAHAYQISVDDSRFQSIANLISGTRPTQGSSESGNGKSDTQSGTQGASSFKIQPELLGGPWFADNTLVMSVTSAKPAYWRATAKEYYDGKKWVSKGDSSGKGIIGNVELGYRGIKTENLEQKIQLSANFTSSVGFGANMPIQVNGLKGPYAFDANMTIDLSIPDTKPGTTYKVISQVPILDDSSLEALRNSGNNYPTDIKGTYLNLPLLPERVRNLALEITSAKNNPYDKALALADYFKQNEQFHYDLKPSSTPPDRDFVDYFLFDSKRGYCTYYSTSMAIMARCVGLPSRWVIGYTSGDSNERTPNLYKVTEMNKHAWVEIYFAGIGWIPFEPTKSFNLPFVYENIVTPTQELPSSANSNEKNPERMLNRYKLLGEGGIAVVVLALILVYLWKKKKGANTDPLTSVIKRRHSARRMIIAAYIAFLKIMQRSGKTRLFSQTPREFARAREAELGENMDYVNRLTDLFEQVRYSKASPSSEQVEQAQGDLEAIKHKLR